MLGRKIRIIFIIVSFGLIIDVLYNALVVRNDFVTFLHRSVSVAGNDVVHSSLSTSEYQSNSKLGLKASTDDVQSTPEFSERDQKTIERKSSGLPTSTHPDESLKSIFSKKGIPKRRFPNTLIIGAKKAGTRALLSMINVHPQVCSARLELHYFDQNYDKGLKWYRSRMPPCYENQITLEKTPNYFVVTSIAKDVFEYSKLLNGTLKLILIFRDPTTRAISDFTHLQANSKISSNQSFDGVAIKNDPTGKRHVDTEFEAIKAGVYVEHLRRWTRYFKLHRQILVVSGENLTKQPYEELKKVEKFLNLPSFFKREYFVYNKTKGFYCFYKSMSKPSTGSQITMSNLKCLAKCKGRRHAFVSNETQTLLRSYYRPFNDELYKLVGRNFGWP